MVTGCDDIIGKLCLYKGAVVVFCSACFETEFPSMPQTGLQFAILLLLPLSVGTGNGGQQVSHKVFFFHLIFYNLNLLSHLRIVFKTLGRMEHFCHVFLFNKFLVYCNLELIQPWENSRWVSAEITLSMLDICHLVIKVRIHRGENWEPVGE